MTMKHYDFVFLIQLRYVSKKYSLVEIVKDQHGLQKLPNEFIEAVLYGHTNHKVLILLDGYDEYKAGLNKDIDKAIRHSVGNCLLILTSRPGFVSQELRNRMDVEAFIKGLSKEDVQKYIERLPERDNIVSILNNAKQAGIADALDDPFLFKTATHIHDVGSTFPKTKTQLIGALFEISMDRTTFGVKASKIKNIQQMLNILGELSWKALQDKHHPLMLSKVN